ncbi:hypothetical protein FA95DRAFT_1488816 [Auriscalpium vulgare]|uniref:Uncharacterized protein n=1 Tax=Auriscalpium vulgare TaxID=40419 RepID=A0ACB8S144_9AGAM|nr:hypothetical protein FA95DRAFT_1488816 [Auriscalpium vulgare]
MPKERSLRALAINTSSATPRRTSSPGPPSPTFSETTNVSAINFGENGPAKVITRADLKNSLQSYSNLLDLCSNYQSALLTMSSATAAFADGMETCAGLKGPNYEQGTRLQAAAGLHHLMGNHWHVLAQTLEQSFEKPLRQHLETYRTIVNERSSLYEKALREKSNIIRDTEKRNMNRKERNLQSFREALVVLQRQVDELDELKARHYEEIIEHEEEVWDVVQGKMSVVVRSTLDVFDRFTAKASDPVLEPMLQSVPDPFDSYGQQQSEDQIFSILPPLSIMGPSSSPSPSAGTPRTEFVEFSAATPVTWVQGNGVSYSDPSSEWADAPSSSTPPRSPPITPRSASPPQRPHRTSSPGSRGRAESKLRSVLSVIDEARSKRASDDGLQADLVQTVAVNGSSSTRDSTSSWASFPFGEFPREGSEDTTPRNSTFFVPTQSPERGPGPDLLRSSSPHSDKTTIAVST